MLYQQIAMGFLKETEHLATQIKAFLVAKAVKRPKTLAGYESVLGMYAEFVNGTWPPTEESVNGFLGSCRDRNLSDSTIHKYYRCLKTFCNWLERRNRLDNNPIGLVEEPPRSQPLPRSPDREIVNRLVEFLEHQSKYSGWTGIRDLAIISLALDTGMRIGEISALNIADVDFANLQIFVKGMKTGWDRYAKISRLCARDLARWDRTRAEIAESIHFPRRELSAVFVSFPKSKQNWRRFTPSGIRQMFERKLQQSHLHKFRFHDLRHAYCVYSLEYGNELQNIQVQVGHRNLATTARYLAVVDKNRAVRHEQTTPRQLKASTVLKAENF